MKSPDAEQGTEIFALDTNILLYAYDRSEGRKHEICRELMEDGFRGEITYFVPLQVLSEFYSVIAREKMEMTREDAFQIIKDILEFPNFIVKEVGESTLMHAIEMNLRSDAHYWDSLIVAAMKSNSIVDIYTENTKDFSSINAISPFEG